MPTIDVTKLRRMQELIFQNALRLHFDSITLYRAASYPSAFFLSILSLEEIGKASLVQGHVDEYLLYGDAGFLDTKGFMKALHSHGIKQKAFTRDLLFVFPKHFLQSLYDRRLSTLKENAMYVGFHRKQRDPDLSSRLRTPLSLKKETARKQITIISDYLRLLTHSVLNGSYSWTTPNKLSLFTFDLEERLNSEWKYRGRLSNARIKWLDEFVRNNRNH